ncbi:hypothetical protein A4H97_32615 [Niastella yeongjuensis]|uniref:SH3b domain-containing protein n=1 Tax=Niastella yeongjuensis TaxID=354355 RepID=A0A1V9EGM1_9BACT|nr:SH3 domain-containing protein [Niastella yeongjuensis]OQP45263.1 hypothetical protein A4H97_32615 [Niastella yeongjuensis]SEO27912.1 hypothetical protein SAMN05660816_02474 [Niastella yeongjuensis]
MQKSLPLTLLLLIAALLSLSSSAQLGIIKDPDGFCNVRAEASNQSKIEDTLTNGRFVLALEQEVKNNWLLVDYHKGKDLHSGYIHKSRIVFLKDLTAFNEITATDTLAKWQLNEMQITIKSGPFSKANRKIDGKMAWGNDGRVPRTEYKSIQFKSGTQTLNFPRSGFNDLFEISPVKHTAVTLDKTTGKVYIEAENSDGAGSYLVVWVINSGKIEWREEFIPF